MNIGQIIQYATLFSALVGSLGLAVAFLIHREQVKTQIFLALSARYDEVLHNSSAGVWLSLPPAGTTVVERRHELTISALRFCTLVSLAYFLFLERRISKRMWHLMLRSAERRIRTPWFVREWEHLRFELTCRFGAIRETEVEETVMTTLPDPQAAFGVSSFRPEMAFSYFTEDRIRCIRSCGNETEYDGGTAVSATGQREAD